MLDILRIDYDDNALDIMDKVNAMLAEYGYQFVNDEQDHEGFEVYTLIRHEVPRL
mgnify:CR=1 FL=1